MTVTLSLKPTEGGTITAAADLLLEECPDILEGLGEGFVLVEDAASPFGSGEHAISEIQMTFQGITKDMLEDLRPLFSLVARLLEKHAGEPLTITILIGDGKDCEVYEF